MAGRLSETSSAVNESVASSSTTHGSQRRAIGTVGAKRASVWEDFSGEVKCRTLCEIHKSTAYFTTQNYVAGATLTINRSSKVTISLDGVQNGSITSASPLDSGEQSPRGPELTYRPLHADTGQTTT